MRLKMLSVLWVTALISYASAFPQLRSVQLGGTGPRPVLLGTQPTYSQQLTFGGQQPQQILAQNQALRFPGLQGGQPQTTRPIVLQQGGRASLPSPVTSPYGQSPIGSFPIPPTVRGQQPLTTYRQPSPVIAVSPTSADDDEYEDEEYDDQPQQAIRQTVQTQTTARPILQRVPARQFLQVQRPEPTSPPQQPQRFAVPQQIQSVQQPRTRQRVQVQVPTPTAVYAQQQPVRLGQDSRLGTSERQTTVAPIQTLNRFMRQNEDGSITWGYENEDGSFKEETLGADCVVRGKYGYVDPDGVKREYEYQSGNPCDPNKRGQEEEEEELEDVVGQQRLAGILSARPIQLQQRQRQ